MRLSLLDLIPVYDGQNTADALAATVEVVRLADRLGLERYWFAEHHNMASVASTSPAVTIAAVAGRTDNIVLGSGGVMLPNHSVYTVAEQFALLHALAPGRVELGLGRAPGSDPVVSALLRATGPTSDVDQFPQHVANLLSMLGRSGAELALAGDRTYQVRATPAAAGRCPVWLLGSSEYSAALAARMGLPYVFAHHFSGVGTERALAVYREHFRPSEFGEQPTTFVTVNASVADSEQEALERAMPHLIQMSRLRTGRPLTALSLVEDAPDEPLDHAQRAFIDAMLEQWVVADEASAARQIQQHARRFGVDEVMVQCASANRRDEPRTRNPGRERTVELLARQLVPAVSVS